MFANVQRSIIARADECTSAIADNDQTKSLLSAAAVRT